MHGNALSASLTEGLQCTPSESPPSKGPPPVNCASRISIPTCNESPIQYDCSHYFLSFAARQNPGLGSWIWHGKHGKAMHATSICNFFLQTSMHHAATSRASTCSKMLWLQASARQTEAPTTSCWEAVAEGRATTWVADSHWWPWSWSSWRMSRAEHFFGRNWGSNCSPAAICNEQGWVPILVTALGPKSLSRACMGWELRGRPSTKIKHSQPGWKDAWHLHETSCVSMCEIYKMWQFI